MPTVLKNKTAKVQTKKGYDYSYGYVDLAGIDKYLEEHKLAYDQEIEIVKNEVTGEIVGQYIRTQRYKVKEDGSLEEWGTPKRGLPYNPSGSLNIQEVGSYTTYVRRYSLALAFGLATEDDDGKGAMSKKQQPVKATPAKATEKVVGITDVQIKKIKENADNSIVQNALAYYKKGAIEELSVREASIIIARLNEEVNKE